MKYYIDETKKYGRGVYCGLPFRKNELIEECEILALSHKDTITLQNTDLKYYTFKYDESRDCLVLGVGEIFNHSDQPNVGYKLHSLSDKEGSRKVMYFYALKDIDEGEQLMIDYTQDVKDTIPEEYKTNLIG